MTYPSFMMLLRKQEPRAITLCTNPGFLPSQEHDLTAERAA